MRFRKSSIRADQLELPFLVLHPGAHLGAGEEAGLEKIVNSIDAIFGGIAENETRIALETTAGQGSCLGHGFEHIAAHHCQCPRAGAALRLPRYGACVRCRLRHRQRNSDAADVRDFDRTIGLDRLAALHLNDSKTARGSRVDRHEHIGKGQIGLDAFRFIMRDRRFRKIPKVLETPKGKELKEDVENMKVLLSLEKRSLSG